MRTLRGHASALTNLFALPALGGELASVSFDGEIKIWDLKRGVCLQTLCGESRNVLSLLFVRSTEELASCSSNDKQIKVWPLAATNITSTNTSGNMNENGILSRLKTLHMGGHTGEVKCLVCLS